MLVSYIQNSPIFGDKKRNFKQIEEILGNRKTDLLVLPELFATGYTFIDKNEVIELAEDINNSETAEFLKDLSIKIGGGVVVGGFIEKEDNFYYNSSLIISNGKLIDTYRKIHLFYKEKLWFTPGNKPFMVYDFNNFKMGVMICFDWYFPEAMRTMALKGADIIAHCANLVMPYCQKAMVTRCLENRTYAITANRIGNEKRGEDNFNFTGGSQITAFNGDILSSAPINEIFTDTVEINPTEGRNKKINPFNDLWEDRRINFYQY